MSRERLYLFDTTLRDGAQTNGVDFTLHDKRIIAQMLDELGIDYVEGGYPGANPTDTEFFAEKPKFESAKFTAFGMTKRVRAAQPVQRSRASMRHCSPPRADAICFVAKTWDYQVQDCAGDHERGRESGGRSVPVGRSWQGRRRPARRWSIASTFFDGYKANAESYALACAKAAL